MILQTSNKPKFCPTILLSLITLEPNVNVAAFYTSGPGTYILTAFFPLDCVESKKTHTLSLPLSHTQPLRSDLTFSFSFSPTFNSFSHSKRLSLSLSLGFESSIPPLSSRSEPPEKPCKILLLNLLRISNK